MGTILAFRRDDEAAVPLAKPASGSLGEIIIFPGVRIERGLWRDKPAEKPNSLPTPMVPWNEFLSAGCGEPSPNTCKRRGSTYLT